MKNLFLLCLLVFIPIKAYTFFDSHALGLKTLNPRPDNPDDPLEQLRRFEGQTKFLNPSYFDYRRYPMYHNARGGEGSDRLSKEKRDVQESDVFKVGLEGENLLYLLNNHRGLQVVSFKDGALNPKLLGRTRSSGNYADDMYFQKELNRLVVLESFWSQDISKQSSELSVYDVSDPTKPQISQKIEFKGRVQDSRLVGDILYVVSRSDRYWRNVDDNDKNKDPYASIHSFSLKKTKVELINTYHLDSPLAYGELMRIVEEKKDDGYAYYLLAVGRLGKWPNPTNEIYAVDISSPEGKISPLMKAKLLGTIRERSQINIKDNHLVAISNYRPEGGRLRVAVETFKLPLKEEIIDHQEASYREYLLKQALEDKKKELKGQNGLPLKNEKLLKEYEERLVSGKSLYKDHSLKLRNTYVEEDENTFVRILMESSRKTVGSTQDLHANIQDVRFQGDLLYVYWVPQNMIDPLDVFDISKVEEGTPYKGRLLFEGWIERAIPLKYKNQDYIVGLGYELVNEDNERALRLPKAMLFKITQSARGKVKKEIVSSMTISKERKLWINFNSADKFIEVNYDKESGQGAILFEVHSYQGPESIHGGKIIGFDISMEDEDEDQVFQEGGFLAAESGWLRRVFTNPEIKKINTFTDESLSTFSLNLDLNSMGHSDEIFKAMSVLELARNVQAFFLVGDLSKQVGVQVISKKDKTHLRFVNQNQVDAEKDKVLKEIILDGRFYQGLSLDSGKLLLALEKELVLVDFQDGDPQTVTHKIDISNDPERRLPPHYNFYHRNNNKFLSFEDSIYYMVNNKTYKISIDEQDLSLESIKMKFQNCKFEKEDEARGIEILSLNNKPYVYYSLKMKKHLYSHLTMFQNFLAPLKVTDEQLVCLKAINIPGKPVSLKDQKLVTFDRSLTDLVIGENNDISDVITQDNLISLEVTTSNEAQLHDLYEATGIDKENIKVVAVDEKENVLLLFKNDEKSRSVHPYAYDMRVWPPSVRDTEKSLFSYLKLDDHLRFVVKSFMLKPSMNNPKMDHLQKVNGDEYQLVLSSWRKLQIISFELWERPKFRNLALLDPNGELLKEAQTIDTYQRSYWFGRSSSASNLTYLKDHNAYALSQGLYGLDQIFIKN